MKHNVRGAGRKRALSTETINIIKRYDAGKTVTALAAEYGVSRQTLSTYLHPKKPQLEFRAFCGCQRADLIRDRSDHKYYRTI